MVKNRAVQHHFVISNHWHLSTWASHDPHFLGSYVYGKLPTTVRVRQMQGWHKAHLSPSPLNPKKTEKEACSQNKGFRLLTFFLGCVLTRVCKCVSVSASEAGRPPWVPFLRRRLSPWFLRQGLSLRPPLRSQRDQPGSSISVLGSSPLVGTASIYIYERERFLVSSRIHML